jgi:hypothetical protein
MIFFFFFFFSFSKDTHVSEYIGLYVHMYVSSMVVGKIVEGKFSKREVSSLFENFTIPWNGIVKFVVILL